MRVSSPLLLAVVAVLASVGPATPQAPPDSQPILVRIIPRVGLLAPDAYLYEQYTNFSGDGPVEWTNGNLGRAMFVGLGVEAGRAGGAFLVRAELLRSFGGWLTAAHSVVVPRELYEAPYVQTTWLDARAALTVASVDLVFPTRLMLWRAQPYIQAGVAGKRYDFDAPTRPNEVEAIMPSNGFTWGGDVGVGFTVPVRRLALDVQARDAINRYWGKTEHDFLISIGFLWQIR
jgi:hypothetical protein